MMDIFDLKKVKFPEKKRLVNPPSSSDLGVNVIFDKRKGHHFAQNVVKSLIKKIIQKKKTRQKQKQLQVLF